MAVSYQLTIDCHDPDLLAHFWAAALGYDLEPPPDDSADSDADRETGLPCDR